MVKKVEPVTEGCMLEVYKLIPRPGTALGPRQCPAGDDLSLLLSPIANLPCYSVLGAPDE